jgi:hypothetical protein
MPTTPILLLPYPAPGDPADVPTDMNELATRLETVITGATSGLTKIQDIKLASPAANIDFTGIPATYTWLTLRAGCRSDAATTAVDLLVRFNGDSTGSYYDVIFSSTGTTMTATEGLAATSGRVGALPAASAPAGWFGLATIDVNEYASGNPKLWVGTSHAYWAATSTSHMTRTAGGAWAATNAITRVTLLASTGNLVAGSHATLYGMA